MEQKVRRLIRAIPSVIPLPLRPLKKALLTTLQVAVTLVILYVLFRDPERRAEMAHTLSKADSTWLILGFLVYGVVELVAGLRWQILLRVQGIELSWLRLWALLLIGVFFNFFIPGGTGGDIVKTFYLLKETPGKRTVALLSVLVDRLIGLIALIIFAGVFTALNWHWLTSSPTVAKFVWPALIILAASLMGLHGSYLVSSRGWIHRLPARLPGRDKLAELAMAYTLYGKAWRASLSAFGLSVIAHFAYIGVFYCAARALHFEGLRMPTYLELVIILPLVNTLSAMPISLGGLGVREGLFQIFLHQLCGVRETDAVLISSTGYLLTFFWGLIGGALYLFYRPSDHSRLRDINTEMAALEHTVAEEEIALEATEHKKR
jgi:uncharacterized protein (TIRG00374 family)